jgi:hypothetical protein
VPVRGYTPDPIHEEAMTRKATPRELATAGRERVTQYEATLRYLDQADFLDIAPPQYRKDADKVASNVIHAAQAAARKRARRA